MGPDHGEDSISRASGEEPRATFREERDRILLANPAFALGFATANGNLVSLYHPQSQVELIDAAEAAADGFLWRLEIASEGGEPVTLTNCDAAEFTHSLGYHRHHGNLRLWLQWSKLRAGSAPVDGRVTVNVTFPPNTPIATFEAEIQLPAHLTVRSFSFPCLSALRSPDPLADDALFLPVSAGILISDPCSALRAGSGGHWQISYPGPASMQFFGYSCEGRTTAWLAAGDSKGALKTMAASAMPRSNRLALTITHYPTRRPDQLWSTDYPTAVGTVFGDWFEAAREYRTWARQQPWCARGKRAERGLPALTSSYGLWTSHWGGPRSAAAAAREVQRLVNIPIKLDWRCWHGCARQGTYPDYFPPREGSELFARVRQQLADSGVLAQFSINGLLASPDSEAWGADKAEPYSILTSPGDAAPVHPTSSHTSLTPMCPATRYWREKLAALARQAVQHGADGVYLEDLLSSHPLLCRDADHGHGPPTPTQWAAGLRASVAAVRSAVGDNVHLGAEGLTEICLDLVDAHLTQHAAAERESLFSDQLPRGCTPIPLFSAVYHDYATLLGPDLSLVNHRPHDPLWPADAIADLRSPSSLMSRDYQAQFCLELGRAVIWGYHPVLANFSPQQARDESSHRKLAFLTATLRAQAWGVGALLPYSEFMGPLQIESPPIDVDLLVNPLHASPEDRRATRHTVNPVLGSAWRTPASSLTLLLVNIHTQSRDFTARLRSSRLALQLPLRLVGRTFSEDGDAPAASLRPAGSEISGRLPGRSFLLISLH